MRRNIDAKTDKSITGPCTGPWAGDVAVAKAAGYMSLPRRGAGVVERDGLENRCTGNRTVGSNPTLSASLSHINGWPI